ILFALGVARWGDLSGSGAVHGLKIAAVAVVAQAVWGMAKSLCPDGLRAGLAIFAALLTLAVPGAWGQVGAIVACGVIGWLLLELPDQLPATHGEFGVSRRAGVAALALFGALLVA